MKPFELEAVLRYRKRLKDIAINKFEEAKKQFDLVRVKLAQANKERENLIDTLAGMQRQGVDIQDHIRFETRIEFLGELIKRMQGELDKKQAAVVRARNVLMQKSKEQKVMEKLKEKQNSEWRQFLDKKEAAMLDEIAVLHGKR